MSFWKILAGAAAGVGTVAALPIAGPVGVVTAVGAAVAGTVGAAGGAAVDTLGDGKKLEKIQRALKKMKDRAEGADQRYNQIVALTAVGIACANCDGEIHPDERAEIDDFMGILRGNFPESVKEEVDKLWKNPPKIETAFKLAEKAGVLSEADEAIDYVMHADNRVHASEETFMSTWRALKALHTSHDS